MKTFDVSVFGLGYVGTVTSACLARDGHRVIGVDVNPEKVDMISAGSSPVVEPGVPGLLEEAIAADRLGATTAADEAVRETEVSLVSVGTPSSEGGGADISHVLKVCEQIAEGVAAKGEEHAVVIRSTVPPGTLRRCRKIFREKCDGDRGGRIVSAFNPEFLREGSALADFDSPPYTVIGTEQARAEEIVRGLYGTVDAPVYVVAPEVAEMVKYVSNAWHGTKVAFANEIGRIADGFGVDGRDVMELVLQDRKLNISDAYLRPGFAYGGSCLPKDLAALVSMARDRHVDVPVLSSVEGSNQSHVDRAVRLVLEADAKAVGLLGLAFKPGTDDLRESPSVTMVKRLLGEGRKVRIFDPTVYEGRLMGTNLAYIRENLPHFDDLLVPEPEDALEGSDLVVVAHATAQFRRTLIDAAEGTSVLDLAGLFDEPPAHLDYRGIVW